MSVATDTSIMSPVQLCANADCGRPFTITEGWGGCCDPCAARESDHLAGEHVRADAECRFCA